MTRKPSLDTTLWTSFEGSSEPSPEAEALIESVVRPETERSETGRLIARGGMGQIEELLDFGLQRRAARKILPPEHRNDLHSVRLFVREAQITSHLDHPSIVPVHGIGLDEQKLYFTMKLVEGETLADRIATFAGQPLERAALFELLEILVKVSDALALAHSRGVLHLDVKPDNIMVGHFGEVYLMDWGIARFKSGYEPPEGSRWSFVETEDQDAVVGTLAYMSPEQASIDHDAISERTDVFGLGSTLFEALTGRAPYHGLSYSLALSRALRGQFPTIAEAAPERNLPLALETIVQTAMAPDPADRYASVTALKAELLAFMHGEASFPVQVYLPGDPIVSEGDEGDSAYIIESGQCRVYKQIRSKQIVIRDMEPGEIFGETAILAPGPRTASVVAVTEVRAQLVTAKTLLGELETMRPWMGRIVRTLATRFRETQAPNEAPPNALSANGRETALQLVMYGATFGTMAADDVVISWDVLPASIRAACTDDLAELRQRLALFPDIHIERAERQITVRNWRALAQELREQCPSESQRL